MNILPRINFYGVLTVLCSEIRHCAKRQTVGLVLALVCISPFFAQDVLWEKTYGGLQSEYLYDVVPTPDYGFLLVGSSLSGKSGNKLDERVHDLDYWLWKMDETGSLEWQRSYGGNGSDFLYSVSLTLERGFVLAGNSTSGEGYSKREASRGKEDIWILRLSPKGDELWQKTIGGTGRDMVKQIVTLKDGGFIIGGSSDERSRLIIKSKTQSPFSRTYEPTEATRAIWNEILKSRKE